MGSFIYTKLHIIPSGLLAVALALGGCGGSGGGSKTSSSAASVAVVSNSSLSSAVASGSATSAAVSSSESSSLAISSADVSLASSSASSAITSSAISSRFSSSSIAAVQTGLLIDSAVAGIYYETSPGGFSGKTASDGAYNYAIGDTVVFSIGALTFPAVAAKDVVTPLDMANTTDPENRSALNIAALLQSLDSDGDLDNGIAINYDKAAASAQAINFDVAYDAFAALPAVINLVANSGSVTTALVSKASAATHLRTTLEKKDAALLIGTWHISESNGFRYVLFFLDSRNYAALTYEGGATFERGTYRWNKATGALTIDTTEVAGNTRKTIPLTNGNVLAVDGEVLTLKGTQGTTALTKLHSATNPLIGGWFVGAEDTLSVFAFTGEHYFHGQNGKDVFDGQGILTGTAGAEYGTYINGASGFVVKTLADSNKQWGFSHPCNIVETHKGEMPNDYSCLGSGDNDSLTVSGDSLDFYSAANVIANETNDPPRNNEPEHYYFNRVMKNDFEVFGLPHPLLGSWTSDDGKDIFIFSDYKTFAHIKTATDDPNCKAGIVNATYTWDQKTFRFKLNVFADTTGGCAADADNHLLKPNGNKFELTEGTDIYAFTKSTSSTGLIGSWILKTATSHAMLVFTDTAYFLADYDASGTDGAPLYGTEQGTYTYSAGTAYFSVINDRNGTRGFSDGSNSSTPWPIGLSGDGDSFTIGDGFVMKRLK